MLHRLLLTVGMLLMLVCPSLGVAEDPPAGLRELDGTVTDWHSYLRSGKWLLVKVWAPDCPVCNETVHEIVALDERRGGKDLVILGIALHFPGDNKAVEDYIVRHRIQFHNLLDDGSNVAQIYRQYIGTEWGGWTPTFLLFTPGGELAATNIGPVRAVDVNRFIDEHS